MSLAILVINAGSLENGCDVLLRIRQAEHNNQEVQTPGRLPPNLELFQSYHKWRQSYRDLNSDCPTIIDPKERLVDCRKKTKKVEDEMEAWLKSHLQDWLKIREQVRDFLQTSDYKRLMIQTNDEVLWKLPWHCWDLLQDNKARDVEIAFSPIDNRQCPKIIQRPHAHTPKVLAVMGNDVNINLGYDHNQVQNLGATILTKPMPQEFFSTLRDSQGWDILFFAGHSKTVTGTGEGSIELNESHSISIRDFKNSLTTAINQGLKIAIFNSCDGLGLAQNLAHLNIPVTIVWREPISDEVAQKFVVEFFKEYTVNHCQLETALRRARERLEDCYDSPAATWMPIIFHNPNIIPPTWSDLTPPPPPLPPPPSPPLYKRFLVQSVLPGVILTILMIFIRGVGLLQIPELQFFDSLTRLRLWLTPTETVADSRLLLVRVTNDDIAYQNENGLKREFDANGKQESLSQTALTQLLNKLAEHEPRVVGLDLFRSRAIEAKIKPITICQLGGIDPDANIPIPPPPDTQLSQISFADIPKDPDGYIRRQLIGASKFKDTEKEDDICHLKKNLQYDVSILSSFSFKLVRAYLQKQSNKLDIKFINSETPNGKVTEKLLIGNKVFRGLNKYNVGGYRLKKNEDLGGFQIMINYPHELNTSSLKTLKDVLTETDGQKLDKLIRDKIVLIGTTAPESYGDLHNSLHNMSLYKNQTPGVMVHAYMINNMLNAVLDHKPTVWWWAEFFESFWILVWALVGTGIAFWFKEIFWISLGLLGAVIILLIFCYATWVVGGWIPFIPPVLVLLLGGVTVTVKKIFKKPLERTRINYA